MGCLGAINVVLIHRTASLQHELKNLFPSGTDKAGSNLTCLVLPPLIWQGSHPQDFGGDMARKRNFLPLGDVTEGRPVLVLPRGLAGAGNFACNVLW